MCEKLTIRTKIVVLMAMHAEAMPVIQALGLVSDPDAFPQASGVQAYVESEAQHSVFRQRSVEVSVVHVGVCDRFGVDSIGTQPATLATYLALTRFKPDLVISAGTCGGFLTRGSAIGDIYLADGNILFHDRRINLPGFDRYGLGHYQPARIQHHALPLGFKLGVVSSGNSLDMPDVDRAVMDQTHTHVKDMEAAAVAWVCERFSTPMTALKAVTDLVDGNRSTAEEFLANLQFASERLCSALLRLLARLADEDPHHWRLHPTPDGKDEV